MPPVPRRILLALALAAALAARGAAAVSRDREGPPSRLAAAVADLPDLVARAWSRLAAVWTKAGCGLDPSGLCAPHVGLPSPPVKTAEGCGMDPGGHCVSTPAVPSAPAHTAAGCGLEPNGFHCQ